MFSLKYIVDKISRLKYQIKAHHERGTQRNHARNTKLGFICNRGDCDRIPG